MADKVSIEIEVRKIGQGLEQVKKELTALANQVKAEGTKIRAETSRLDQGFKGIGGSIRGIKALLPAGLAGLLGAAGLYNIAKSIFDTAVSFETMAFQLRAVSKSVQEADAQFKMIREFAARTPFMTKNVTEAFIQLKAVGLAPTKREMEIFGDTAFAMGRDITDVAQSIIALETEVLRRLGIQLDRTGKKAIIMSGEMRIEVENNFDAIRKAVIEVWEKRFPNAMKEAEKTTSGALAILKSEFTELADIMGKVVLPEVQNLSGALAGLTSSLRKHEDQVKILIRAYIKMINPINAARMIWDKLFGSGVSLLDILDDLSQELDTFEGNVEDIGKSVRKTTNDMAAFNKELDKAADLMQKAVDLYESAKAKWIAGIEAQTKGAKGFREELEKTADLIQKMNEEYLKAKEAWVAGIEAQTGKAKSASDEAAGGLRTTWDGFAKDMKWSLEAGLFDVFKDGFTDLEGAAKSFLNMLVESFARAVSKMIAEWLMLKAVMAMGNIIGGAAGGGAGGMVSWEYMQHGGLINEPMWAISKSGRGAILGEAGPEAVIPLRDLSTKRETTQNIWIVDERAKTPPPSKNDIILIVSEDIRSDGPIRKTIKHFT